FVLFWWLVTVTVGGVFTLDPPAVVRLVGLVPALAILAALPLAALLRLAGAAPLRRGATVAIVGVLLAAAGWQNWRTYFVEFAQQPLDDTSALARELKRPPSDAIMFLLGSEPFVQLTRDAARALFALAVPGRR